MGKKEYYVWVGETLKVHRLRNNLTLEQVGLKLGVSTKQVQYWETAERKITVPTMVELCSIYGIDVNEFFTKSIEYL